MSTFRASSTLAWAEDESGVGLLEFALAASVLLTMIFGIMDGARGLYAEHYVSNAARDATRYAMVRGSTYSGTSCSATSTYSCAATKDDVANYVKSVTPTGFSANNLVVTTTWPGTNVLGAPCDTTNGSNSPGCVVQVKVSYSFNFVLPFLPQNALLLSSTSEVAISQ